MKSKMLAKKLLAVLGIASLVFLVGCGGTTGQSINQPPIPAITTISPNSAESGGAAFTQTVNGSNFVTGSSVRWNGSDRPTGS